ncbi:hypothetical protein V5S96_02650 [Corynebacterium mastitidis]|uniref:Uncharacterized protein n=1 Tax=Corynebacterium mastitidis TaxID=161890 RepID=A0ABU8NZ30_9CORY
MGAAVFLVLYLRDNDEEPTEVEQHPTTIVELSSAITTTEEEEEESAETATVEPQREYSSYRSANTVTTEGFAANVFAAFREAYAETGSTQQSMIVYSPTTKLDYRMTCSGEVMVTCRGGKNAVVEIW